MEKKRRVLAAALVMSIFMAMAMASTGDDDKPKKETASNASVASSAKAEEVFTLNETAAFKTMKITANEIKTSNGSEYNKPAEGKIFVGVKFTVENISDEDQAVSSLMLFDAYVDDVKLDFSFTAAVEFKDGTLDGTLSPGKKMIGYYSVEVPTATEKLTLEVKSSIVNASKATFEFTIPK